MDFRKAFRRILINEEEMPVFEREAALGSILQQLSEALLGKLDANTVAREIRESVGEGAPVTEEMVIGGFDLKRRLYFRCDEMLDPSRSIGDTQDTELKRLEGCDK